MTDPYIDIEKLDADQRLQLIERLWDSLEDSALALPLTAAQKRELDSRLDRIDAGDDAGIPWEEIISKIKSKPG
jgi:putative addiction module component (TIGR02574 family)